MKKILLFLVIGYFSACISFGQTIATDIFISEYCEWNHKAVDPQTFNQYIEIYNGTGEDIDLTKYELWRAKNGGGWGLDGTIEMGPLSLEGTLANGETFVIARPVEDPCEVTANMHWDFLNISGDDAVGLAKDDGNGTFILIDVVGEPENDPGSGWDVGDSIAATMNHTLIRKADIGSPTTDWATSAGTSTANSQWIVKKENDTLDINMHTSDFTGIATSGTKVGEPLKERGIYPSPSNGSFFYTSDREQIINIIDISGRNIASVNVTSGINPLNLDLISGVYLLISNNNTKVDRLVIQK